MPKRAHTSSLQAMLMMNSKVVLDRVKAEGDSQVDQLLDSKARTTTAWLPSCKSRRSAVSLLRVRRVSTRELEKDRKKGLENLQWSLLNSPEFLFNY